MAVNKVIYDGNTLVDLTETTATASDVAEGKVFLAADGTVTIGTAGGEALTILKYGTSTWANFIAAYNTNSIVYCRASSNSNPATGSQTRLAFMAYVNNETNPTNVEFQYYRSVSSHSNNQQGDQVYVYKLDKTAGWTVTVRENYTKVVAGTGLQGTWSNGAITLANSNPLPSVSASDNGKILRVSSGAWTAELLPSASGVSF